MGRKSNCIKALALSDPSVLDDKRRAKRRKFVVHNTSGVMRNIRVPFVVPHIAKLAASVLAFGVALTVDAAEYDCTVEKKVDRDREYSTEQISRSQFANRIEEVGEQAWVSRCSFAPSAGKVTCDRLKMDRVVIDPKVKIKKFYMFSAQFDLQLYPDLTYVENNGRGGISYGNCTLVAP